MYCPQSYERSKKKCFVEAIITIIFINVVCCLCLNIYKLRNLNKQLISLEEEFAELKKSKQETFSSRVDEINERPDYALRTTGGKVVRISNTETYSPVGYSLFPFSICEDPLHSPDLILQARTLQPGECWPFKGSTGTVVIELIAFIKIDSVSVFHITKAMSPFGNTPGAPKDFIVLGLQHADDENGVLLGQFQYNNNGKSVQTFPIKSDAETNRSFKFVEFTVKSNYGQEFFTCIYR